ncbi:MAG: ABC transporter ATP-binding protein [Bacteroidales bacterium]|nr:ABC transporter ATP-binding protein [Candidatus Sodaliphilus aphodohippi]
MTDNENIISIHNLYKSFGTKEVLHDISLDIRRGEFVTILGPSGCGKTTLLRILAGFEKQTQGEVLLGGEDITNMPAYERPMNTVFQKYALFPHLNVYDNIAFGLKMKGVGSDETDKRVMQALKMVGMTDYEERDVDSLSGGQQQRVAIARAIVNRPQVLLLDEPLSALDRKMRQDMQLELKDMHKTLGITFIFVTHDQEEALTLSDTVVVMNEGLIQQVGSPIDIYNEPVNPFVADFIGESNILDGVMHADYEVEFMGQTVKCVDKGFDKDEIVDVVIRPEDIYLLKRPEDGQWQGTVQSCIFKGIHYEMLINTPDGYEMQVQDYNKFDVGTTVGMLVKPEDIHVMHCQYTENTFEAKVIDATHVEMLGNTFECAPTDLPAGSMATAHVSCSAVELTDNAQDGTAEGEISFILYKGDHYHLTIDSNDGTRLYVNTTDVWEDYDIVGIRINPPDINLTPLPD